MKHLLALVDSLTVNLPEWARAGIRRLTVTALYTLAAYAATGASDAPSWLAPLLASLGLGADKARREKKQ